MDKNNLNAKAILKGLVLHNNLNPEQKLAGLKRQALTRRADKLKEWLARPSYSLYTGPESTENLARLTDLIIWALEMSLPPEQWAPFLAGFKACRSTLLGIPAEDDAAKDESSRYEAARSLLLQTLDNYKAQVIVSLE